MERPDIIAHACVHPKRWESAARTLGALRDFCELHVTPARPGEDCGPILKWTMPLPLRERHAFVLILDDDQEYKRESLRRAVAALDSAGGPRGRASMMQAYGRTLNVHHLPLANGGPYLVHQVCWDVCPTDMVEAFAGVVLPVAVWDALAVELRGLVGAGLSPDEKLADDLVVSRAAHRIGIGRWVAPVEGPRRMLPAALESAVSRAGDGLAARYKRLLIADHSADRCWWPLRGNPVQAVP